MIELFNTPATSQTEKHYSTIREDIVVLDTASDSNIDFCTCIKQCVPYLKLFTDEVGDDEFKNDWYTMYQNSVTSGSHTLAIIVNGIETAITDNTYGNEYVGTVFYGYKFSAYKIWLQFGYCEFQTVMRNYDSLGNLVQEEYSVTYRLMLYRDETANGTVVIETVKKGSLRHGKKYFDLRMTGGSKALPYWFQRVRLPGKLKRTGLPVELTEVVLNDLSHSRDQVFDTMSTEYDLEIYLVSSDQVMSVILDDLFANETYVTDYNVYNFEQYLNVPLLRTGIEFDSKARIRKSFTIKMINSQKKYEKYND